MKYIIPVVIGAVIGYITNFLAIKMLFRPLREKRIFGKRVPFTPGLIPKERRKISHSVGQTIGRELLSPQVIEKYLVSDNVVLKVKEAVKSEIDRLSSSEDTLKQFGENISQDGYSEVKENITRSLSKSMNDSLKDKDKMSKVIRLVAGEAKTLIATMSREASNNDMTIESILPSNVDNKIEEYIYQKRGDIAGYLKGIIELDNVSSALKSSIAQTLNAKLGRLIAMFANTNSMADKIYDAIYGYLNNPENYNQIGSIAVDAFGMLKNKKIKDISILNDNKALEVAMDAISENASSQYEEDIYEHIIGLIPSETIDTITDSVSKKLVELVEGIKIKELVGFMGSPENSMVEEKIADLYKKIIKDKAVSVIGAIDISKIVEDEINGFDIEYAEKIILDISKKELSAITWLGAVLGGIMGILMPLINSIFM